MLGTYPGSSQVRSQGLACLFTRLEIYILEATGDAIQGELYILYSLYFIGAICLYICLFVCTFGYLYIICCLYFTGAICLYICTFVCLCIFVHICVYVFIFVYFVHICVLYCNCYGIFGYTVQY